MKPIIEITGISKKFKVQEKGTPYLSLRDHIMQLLASPKKKTGKER